MDELSVLDGPTAQLVGLAASTGFDDLSAEAVAAAKRHILDLVCCAVAGVGEGSGAILADVVAASGGRPEATVLGSGQRLPALSVTAINAHAANVLDADDTVRYKGHVGAATVPTALAFAEREAATGRDLIAAVVAGYEVATRIGLSLKAIVVGPSGTTEFAPVTGYSWAGFASTVVAGRLIGLTVDQMRNAFGITGSTLPLPGSTPFGTSLPRPMTKYLMYGTAAQAGAFAALLAQRGFTGEPAILDGDKGLWRALGSLECEWTWMLERPAGRWLVEDACVKPYPACRFNNPAIDLLLEMVRAHGLDPASVEDIEVLVPAAGLKKHRADLAEPQSLVDASFSLPHLLGAAAFAGPPGVSWLTDRARTDPRIRALASKVRVGPEPRAGVLAAEDLAERGHLARMPTTMTITAGGRQYTRSADYARGDVFDESLTFTEADLATKFRDFCGHLLTDEQIESAVALIGDLENQDDVSKLVPQLVADPRHATDAASREAR